LNEFCKIEIIVILLAKSKLAKTGGILIFQTHEGTNNRGILWSLSLYSFSSIGEGRDEVDKKIKE